ncbi:MAG: hypothetical protein ACRD2N_23510 [Vicinamibacterales bacterium]
MASSNAATVKEYLAEPPPDRRKTIAAARALVRKHIPKGYKEVMQWGMIYLRETMAEAQAFAQLMKQPTVFDELATVQTHAFLDAPLAAPGVGVRPCAPAGRIFPVLVFQHGYTGIPSSYTALMEDLASRGYAVLSIIHPYEATAATLEDGKVVTFLNEKGTMHQGIMDVLNEWAPKATR